VKERLTAWEIRVRLTIFFSAIVNYFLAYGKEYSATAFLLLTENKNFVLKEK